MRIKVQIEWVLQVLEVYNISYTLNRFGGYKINYNDTVVDLWLAEDLFSSQQYNVDGLYFEPYTESQMAEFRERYKEYYVGGIEEEMDAKKLILERKLEFNSDRSFR